MVQASPGPAAGAVPGRVSLQLEGPELESALPLLAGGLGLEVVSFSRPALLDGDWQTALADYRQIAGQVRGPLSLHGPFLDLNPVSPEPRLRRITRDRYARALDVAAALEARHVVFHTQYNPLVPQAGYDRRWVEESAGFWAGMLVRAEAAGITVVLENMWDPSPGPVSDLIDAVARPSLRACLDTGHARLFSPLSPARWVELLGPRLAYVHLTDNHGRWDDHLPLGEGCVDFQGFFRALAAVGLEPLFVVEVKSCRAAVGSLRVLGWLKGAGGNTGAEGRP